MLSVSKPTETHHTGSHTLSTVSMAITVGPIPSGPRTGIISVSLHSSSLTATGWPGQEQGTEPRTSSDQIRLVASATKQSLERDPSIQKPHPTEPGRRLGTHWHSSLEEWATKELVNVFTLLGTVLNTRKNECCHPKEYLQICCQQKQ